MSFLSDTKEKIPCVTKPIVKWVFIILSAAAVGLISGAVGGAFARSITFVTALREEYPWIIYLLPAGGLVSAGIYKLAKAEGIGTKTITETARGGAETPVLLLPAIFTASVITHLFGGSAGKEGAALQIGSSVAALVSKITKADVRTRSLLTVCGMAALFSAVFGTPVGACVFAFELVFAGSINALAIFPVIVSSLSAHFVSSALGVACEEFDIGIIPDFGIEALLRTLGIAITASLAAYVFCRLLHGGEKLSDRFFRNPFIKIFVGGCAVTVLTLIFGTDYNGGGMFVIKRIFEEGTFNPEAFLLKMIFTVITVSSGYKGGEIVPSFFIGATLGAALSSVFGLPVGFAAAIGMTAFFGGVTNCPITAAVLSVELFGTEGFVMFAAAAFISRAFSGRISLNRTSCKDCCDTL